MPYPMGLAPRGTSPYVANPPTTDTMPALAIWTPEDAMLGAIVPLGLGVAAPGPALVVDLDSGGPAYFGSESLAGLVADGPRRHDLSASRTGVAVLRNGGIRYGDAAEVVSHLLDGWPHVVLRLPTPPPAVAPTTIRVTPLLPAGLMAATDRTTVYQDAGWRVAAPGPGVVLPIPRRGTWAALAQGQRPATDRWLRALRGVWAWA
jgi:hypothetical protein